MSTVTIRKFWLLTLCIFFSVEKKKSKKEVVVVSISDLKENSSFARPIMQYDPFYEWCLFSEEKIEMIGKEKNDCP